MKTYKTEKTVDLFCGRIGLTEDQYEPRAGKLQPVGEDVYEITGHVQFKRGEVIRLQDPDKRTAGLLIEIQ